MMKTVTSLFQSEQHATAAVSHLEQAGIRKAGIDIWSTPHNLAPLLEDAGVSRSDAAAYVEGVLRGGNLVDPSQPRQSRYEPGGPDEPWPDPHSIRPGRAPSREVGAPLRESGMQLLAHARTQQVERLTERI
jgi:hypothetical protein